MEMPVYHLEGVMHTRPEPENFDGPLDLILSLLSKNKMDIQDIQISLILEQYLAWMDRQKELNLDVASEFVAMASHLVYIKTRMLLAMDDEQTLSEMEELVSALEARRRSENYAKVKLVLPQLRERFSAGCDYLARGQLPVTPDKTYRYRHEPGDLLRTMQEIIDRNGEKPAPPELAFRGIVGREPYPVAEKTREVLNQLLRGGVTRFRSLFRSSRSRSEIVATFLAVLELCREHRVHLAGFGEECTLARVSDAELPEETERGR